jgi:hypothetical protein
MEFFNNLLEAEGTFVLKVFVFERVELVPEGKSSGDHDADEDADEEEKTVGGQRDQQNRDYNDRDDETRRSLQTESRSAARFGLHDLILARPSVPA